MVSSSPTEHRVRPFQPCVGYGISGSNVLRETDRGNEDPWTLPLAQSCLFPGSPIPSLRERPMTQHVSLGAGYKPGISAHIQQSDRAGRLFPGLLVSHLGILAIVARMTRQTILSVEVLIQESKSVEESHPCLGDADSGLCRPVWAIPPNWSKLRNSSMST